MDWIKVKPKHALIEYSDFSDKEFRAWISIMCLAAELEKQPSEKQVSKYVHYKTLKSLQERLKDSSISLQHIVNKVLIDVQDTIKERESWKLKKRQQRDDLKLKYENVPQDIPRDVPKDVPQNVPFIKKENKVTKQKKEDSFYTIHEHDNNIYNNNIYNTDLEDKPKKYFVKPKIEEVESYCKERGNSVNPSSFINFYESKGWMVGKNKMKDWKAAVRTWEQSNRPQVKTFKERDEERELETIKRFLGKDVQS